MAKAEDGKTFSQTIQTIPSNQDTVQVDRDRGHKDMTSKKTTKDNDIEPIIKKEVRAYKYSAKGTSSLYEAIIVRGKPHFITWSQIKDKFTSKPQIEEATRIIRPPSAEEYPYTPYEFTDEAELNDYFRRANDTSLDELYNSIKSSFLQKYVDQDLNIITILSADIIFTYFQDLYAITHYLEGIGGNDVGKSSIGYVLESIGYRVVRGSSISGANYYRVLGNVEPGQCTIIEDEADNISEDPDKVKILKAGYESKAKIPKTNMNTSKQETNWYYPYCHKTIFAEKSLSEWKAKGLVDRTWSFKCRPGQVKYSIKDVVSDTVHKNTKLQKLYDQLLDFRKLMLCYRLTHYDNELPELKLSVINRDRELSYPLLQLFYGTKAFEEVKTAIEFFLKQRKRRKARSIYAALYLILKDLVYADHVDNNKPKPPKIVLPYSLIWNTIVSGKIKGTLVSSQQYETDEYSSLYLSTLSKQISDNFSADLDHREGGSIVTFYPPKFDTYDSVYNHKDEDGGGEGVIDIQVQVLDKESDPDPEGSEGSEGSSDAFHNFESENENTNAPPVPLSPISPVSDQKQTCPKCGEESSSPYWFKHHHCD